ncbi:transmembrane 220 family protein [Pontibacter silvestris]|uniref:Transmembrane 220 family protein n=1 Tax=Pontibacter silvestris TaxID=2305183 RepID=A0ABW4X1W6_9BACT|nr:transmembrane 220 family protein [Pontibacter silvestris]MCC9135025.1 transmembrane 220 family protein [Pontibacter silvestris]
MTFIRIWAFTLGFCFLGFAAVQYNDPDALAWIIVYAIAALLSFAAAFNKINKVVLYAACIIYAAGAFYCWPEHFEGVSDSMRDATTGYLIKNVEEGREALGLTICSLAMLSYGLLITFTNKQNRPIINEGA